VAVRHEHYVTERMQLEATAKRNISKLFGRKQTKRNLVRGINWRSIV